jgi:hypothetical protein
MTTQQPKPGIIMIITFENGTTKAIHSDSTNIQIVDGGYFISDSTVKSMQPVQAKIISKTEVNQIIKIVFPIIPMPQPTPPPPDPGCPPGFMPSNGDCVENPMPPVIPSEPEPTPEPVAPEPPAEPVPDPEPEPEPFSGSQPLFL